jgi:Putative Actinobacterial Holin-X, holin superfamily III
MSEEFKKIESLLDTAKEYINTRIAQFKLSVAEKISKLLAVMIAGIVAALVFFFFLLFGSIAAALAIGHQMDSPALGFLMVAGGWLLLGMIIWMAKNRLLRIPIMNAIIGSLFGTDKEHEEDETHK